MSIIWTILDALAAPGPSISPRPKPGTLTDAQIRRVLLATAGITVVVLAYAIARYGRRR